MIHSWDKDEKAIREGSIYSAAEDGRTTRPRPRTRGAALAAVMAVLGMFAVVSLILQHGFSVGARFNHWFNWLNVVLAAGFSAGLVWELVTAARRGEVFRQRRFELLILGGFVAALVLSFLLPSRLIASVLTMTHQEALAGLVFGVVRLFLLGNVCVQLLRSLQLIFAVGVRTELILAGSFAALILSGTLLLLMPRVAADPEAPISLVDCLFTATSAVCVTGLVVRDTGTEFSALGQTIILALFQIGGLGIVTFVAFISTFSAKSLPVPQIVAFREIINAPAMSDLKRRIAGILVLTLVIESAGALCLYLSVPMEKDFLDRVKWSVFHAVSAFCNAGFALQADSLEFASANAGVNATVMLLIVLGGLGFLVLPELIAICSARLRRLPLLLHPSRRRFLPPAAPRLTVQTRISLIVTLLLIVVGIAGFWWLEAGHVLGGKSAAGAFLTSAFQSITARTAGFNTVPIGELQQATLILLILLMVVGGCPVSAAGGIKVVTFGILLLALRSLISQKQNVEAFGRTLPPRVFFTALNVFVLYIATAGACVFLLSVFDPQLALRDTTFETISALSTVGLSTGITSGLSTGSKIVLCVAMFVGRVGPIALVLSVFQSRGRVEYEFPTEDVVVA
jgi:trk system potassium uptake protein TrkH